MAKYVGLSGYARSGKDTVAGMLIEHGWTRFAFADKLKEAVKRLNPAVEWSQYNGVLTVQDALDEHGPERTKELFPEYRRLLQVMGTEVGRDMFGENFWVEQALREVQDGDFAVFTDCRFPNEAKAIKERGGEVWRINRPGFGPVNSHASETSLDLWMFDRVIENDGDLTALEMKVTTALSALFHIKEAIG